MMNYQETLEYIFSIPKFTYPLGNEKLSKLLDSLGNPQKGMKIIHIAGTNGKGSAAAMLCSILEHAGYKTGLFTSPFIQRFNERIRIGTKQISDNRLSAIAEKIAGAGIEVSQFAFILACALVYYAEEECDFVILEAGLGGRLDATNVIGESLVSVIMSIGLDHTEYLGSTIEAIAAEKCGIIKRGGYVAAYRSNAAAMRVIAAECEKMGAQLLVASEAEKSDAGFICEGKEYKLGLEGEYQIGNAAAVLAAVKILQTRGAAIPDAALESGFAECEWQARFQYVRDNVIVDGCHNPDGIAAMCRSVSKIKGTKTAVIAMMEDKAVEECVGMLADTFDEIIVTEIDILRCMSAQRLAEIAKRYFMKVSVASDCNEAFDIAKTHGMCMICGSLYLAGRALDYFEEGRIGGHCQDRKAADKQD